MKTRILLLIIPLVIFLGCSRTAQPPAKIAIEQCFALRDTTTLVRLIDSDHRHFRTQSESILRRFLFTKAMGDTNQAARLMETLSWCQEFYRAHKGIQDFTRKLAFYKTWSEGDLLRKLELDSLCLLFRKAPDQKSQESRFRDLRALYVALGDSLMVGQTAYSLGKLLLDSEVLDSAEWYLQSALQNASSYDDRLLAGNCLLGLASIRRSRGEYVAAQKLNETAAERFEQVGSLELIPYALMGSGTAAFQLGQTGEAKEQYMSAKKLSIELGDRESEAYCDYYLAENYLNDRKLDSAFSYARESSALRADLGNLANLGYSLSCEGLIYQHRGDLRSASMRYDSAQLCFTTSKDSTGLCLNMVRRALLSIADSQYVKAEALCDSVLGLASDYQDSLFGLYGRARCNYGLHFIDSAKRDLNASIALIERSREDSAEPEKLVGFLSDKIECYDLLTKIHIDRYQKTAAMSDLDSVFLVLERSRTQSLREMLNGNPAGDFSQVINLSHCMNRLLRSDREILLEYFLSEFGCCLLTVTNAGASLRELSTSADSLDRLIGKARRLIDQSPSDRSDEAKYKQLSHALFDALVPTGLRDSLAGRQVVVALSGKLTTFPFAALVDDQARYLIESCEIICCPSARVLAMVTGRSKKSRVRSRVIAVGDPSIDTTSRRMGLSGTGDSLTLVAQRSADGKSRLPYANREIDSIAAIFGNRRVLALTGDKASAKNLKSADYSDVRFLHIAAHGVANDVHPALSALLLAGDGDDAGDGSFYPRDILQLPLATDNVFLSACGSGTGRVFPGEGVTSLARPFLVAGSESVVATLWNIDDRSTAEFVARFYRAVNGGAPRATALAEAQRGMLASETELYNHPFFWAPFVLIGQGS